MGNDSSSDILRNQIFRSLLTIVICLGSLGAVVFAFIRNCPDLQEGDYAILKQFPPKTLVQLSQQRDTLLKYASIHSGYILSSFCTLYIVMQTFAIPGTLSLSILAGALYGSYKGLALVTVVSTAGATCCYTLSNFAGKGIAEAIWPEKVEAFGKEIDKRRSDLLSYIVFLRLTPILPNTFINVASPVVRVPVLPFIAGTFLGCIPNNFIAVSAGSKLGELQSLTELYDFKRVFLGLALGVAALLPILLKRRHSPAMHLKGA